MIANALIIAACVAAWIVVIAACVAAWIVVGVYILTIADGDE